MIYLYVGLAGALGAILRYWIGTVFLPGSVFPWSTLFVNLTGAFLLAWLTTSIFKKYHLPPDIAAAISTGFIGSFTTFSALSVETVELFENGHAVMGMAYVFASIAGGLIMSRIGFRAGKEGQQA
ncbi:fluoride efflux transporter CrcB [Ureibacillus sp. FSL K6-8385]|uniref:Fluoride-specific ion channel FluC n=1 Tax=Ureibacillus terrenus TaxID=118246 RepID=A0A540UX38_9BACL|nr:fluoride efflux transporter CrcB [Ureibacillus terrenus]MED3662835.1 fluoride efflux transporter CrcB [Ureibacillus terrenus]MED3762868.1 fluoride efflux transporter CrcB [Ureibacillus terrenus]TQE89049.1 fluoride efflux transporter CrcB [Ureibacillus terrenus]